MSVRTLMCAAGAAALLGATGGIAHAETAKPKVDFSVRNEPATLATQGGKSLKWDTRNGRWGVTLNLEQPASRDMQWNDVEAGAYFRVTPSLRVGGAVALGDEQSPTFKKTEPQPVTPRVRLETAFKF
ncbi:MAG: NtrZ family periplasmic regulatory protein [Phenylobacterium sp.]|uniref:NtrZ family periplasmic regulatory protein n=1 Tax=Phenylobacterium sp. TaxID=1871053 RepID=UPI00391DD045